MNEKLKKQPDGEDTNAQSPSETNEEPKVLFAAAGESAEGSGPDDQHNQPA